MRHVVFLPLLAIFLAADTPKKDDVVSDDQDAILGMWKFEKAVMDGMDMPGHKEIRLEFKKDKVISHRGGMQDPAEYSLDPSKKPREISIKPKNEPEAEGIYELNGDTLKICLVKVGGKRPKTFESKAGSDVALIVLKREKK
jgi:uncharacterized protein (TIGR03067 family)